MSRPALADAIELLKPITWFAPMWAYGCGVVSSGVSIPERWQALLLGIVLAGPMVCGTSQAVNDWFDRHVDAINQPERPIPSGRIPGRWGLYIALIWTALSLALATLLGTWGFIAACVGLALAWAYSAPPLRLKQSGWWGPGAVALSYEGIAWFTGAAVMLNALPNPPILAAVVLYSLGAHGIMTLNDFKAVEGDTQMGVRSLPVVLGEKAAARLACAVMAVPQFIVIGLLVSWGQPLFAAGVAILVVLQLGFMTRLLKDPAAHAPWYNATGVVSYVLGMLITAFAIRLLPEGGFV